MTFGYLWTLYVRVCGVIDLGHTCDEYLVLLAKSGMTDTLHRTWVFAFGGICGSHSAFWCVWGAKVRRTIFMLTWVWYRFDKNCIGTHYTEPVFLHLVGSAGHECIPVHPWRKTSMHYFSSSCGPGAVPRTSEPGHVTPNLCFCFRWNLWVT
jgi:hypothetical protein